MAKPQLFDDQPAVTSNFAIIFKFNDMLIYEKNCAILLKMPFNDNMLVYEKNCVILLKL